MKKERAQAFSLSPTPLSPAPDLVLSVGISQQHGRHCLVPPRLQHILRGRRHEACFRVVRRVLVVQAVHEAGTQRLRRREVDFRRDVVHLEEVRVIVCKKFEKKKQGKQKTRKNKNKIKQMKEQQFHVLFVQVVHKVGGDGLLRGAESALLMTSGDMLTPRGGSHRCLQMEGRQAKGNR